MNPTASSLARAAQCPASTVLPQVERTTPAASRGSALHAFNVRLHEVGLDKARWDVPTEWRQAAEAMAPMMMELPFDAARGAYEVAFAYDPFGDKAREIGRARAREYGPLSDDEIAGTVDWLGLGTDSVVVVDFKTGGTVTPAARNWQLWHGAISACRAYGRCKAVVMVVYLREDAPSWIDCAEFDAFDLLDIRSNMVWLLSEIRAARTRETPDLSMGSECRYCPAFVRCPAQVGLITALATQPVTEMATVTEALMPERAANAYRTLGIIKAAVHHAESALKAYAEVQPIDLGDGLVYGPAPGNERIADQALVRSLLDPAVAEEVGTIEWSTTKGKIEQFLGRRHAADVFDLLRQKGALTRSTAIREHRPKNGDPK